jgi:hypothetical protein
MGEELDEAPLGMTHSTNQKITNSVIVNEGGNTTSDVAAALTLTLSLDRERGSEMDRTTESKNHKL